MLIRDGPDTPLDFFNKDMSGVIYAGNTVKDAVPFHSLGINWYGSEGRNRLPEGLEYRPISWIMDYIAQNRFNSLRLLLNMEDWEADPPIDPTIFNAMLNPEFEGATYREALRIIVRAAAERRILILLANHRLRRSYQDPTHPRAWPGGWDGLWYEHGEEAQGYMTESKVVRLWGEVAGYFCGEWNVFAADLMNEPHMGYWGSTRWEDHPELHDRDWIIGAERLGNSVLQQCPRLLILVEGTAEYGTEWGESFKGLKEQVLWVLYRCSMCV